MNASNANDAPTALKLGCYFMSQTSLEKARDRYCEALRKSQVPDTYHLDFFKVSERGPNTAMRVFDKSGGWRLQAALVTFPMLFFLLLVVILPLESFFDIASVTAKYAVGEVFFIRWDTLDLLLWFCVPGFFFGLLVQLFILGLSTRNRIRIVGDKFATGWSILSRLQRSNPQRFIQEGKDFEGFVDCAFRCCIKIRIGSIALAIVSILPIYIWQASQWAAFDQAGVLYKVAPPWSKPVRVEWVNVKRIVTGCQPLAIRGNQKYRARIRYEIFLEDKSFDLAAYDSRVVPGTWARKIYRIDQLLRQAGVEHGHWNVEEKIPLTRQCLGAIRRLAYPYDDQWLFDIMRVRIEP